MQCKLSVACSYCLVSLFSYCSNKTYRKKCRKRAGVYTGIIVLGEKREVVILLFLFYGNTGVEGGGKWNFHQKKMYGYIQFFFCCRCLFCSYICRERIFSFAFYNSISNVVQLELIFGKIYCRERNNYDQIGSRYKTYIYTRYKTNFKYEKSNSSSCIII